ncbi:MAG: hypothetical protein HGA45_43810, partial [Chloroflexales bacterium]|nr:hypothetical protein [Chloroflexales bacterium]
LPALLGLGAAALPARPARAPVSARTTIAPGTWPAAHTTTALWGAALIAAALVSLRPYPHYYLAAVPLLSLWAGAGLGWLAGRLGAVTGRAWIGTLAAGLALAAVVAPAVAETVPLRNMDPHQQITTLYARDGAAFFAPASEVAAYVDAHVPADKAIFVWAAEPEIYYLARRRPAARFVYDYPVDRLPGARDELLAVLRQTVPRVIITYHEVRPIGVHPFFEDYGYDLAATIGGFDIFARADGVP